VFCKGVPRNGIIGNRGVVPQAQRTHERWSMDLVHDQLFDGRPFRMLTVIDHRAAVGV
jgi:hypothetical protein